MPAGSYKAIRIEISGRGAAGTGGAAFRQYARGVTRFLYTLWYAPAVKRYVKLRQETWDQNDVKYSDEMVELIAYKDKGS